MEKGALIIDKHNFYNKYCVFLIIIKYNVKIANLLPKLFRLNHIKNGVLF